MSMESTNGNGTCGDENKQVIQQSLIREQVRHEVKALVKQVADGYRALENLMEQNPWLAGEMDAQDRERKRAFDDKLRKGLGRANGAPRCRWVKQDGTSCGSPQMRSHIYCYAHRQMMEARALALRLPAMEDANAVQVALMRVQKALIDDHISMKKAGLLLYSLQLGITNVGRTTFGQAKDDDLVTDTVEEQEAMGEEAGAEAAQPIFSRDMPGLREYQEIGRSGHLSIGPSEDQNRKLPLMNTDDTDKAKNLPLMNADERRSEAVHAPSFPAMRMGACGEADMDQMHAKMG